MSPTHPIFGQCARSAAHGGLAALSVRAFGSAGSTVAVAIGEAAGVALVAVLEVGGD